jgi:8-oxo-dGTP pyrophosphatase MutT (NUDIX family)
MTRMEWVVGESRTIYDCAWFRVDVTDVTLPDGREIAHHVIRAPAAIVAVVAVDDGGRVLMMRRHRWITGRWGWELPAGLAEAGEDEAAAAARELAEETGVTCDRWTKTGEVDLLHGLSDHRVCFYRATGVHTGGTITSPEESAELRWLTRAEIARLIEQGQVRDGISRLGLLGDPS